jgi:hypothetical protein
MSPSVFGSIAGIAIGALLCIAAAIWGRSRARKHPGALISYPSPNWLAFSKGLVPLALFLAFVHYLPEITAVLGQSLGKPLMIRNRTLDMVLFVAHTLAFVGLSTDLFGNLWATAQARKGSSTSTHEPPRGDA